jgi:hypothetical protein
VWSLIKRSITIAAIIAAVIILQITTKLPETIIRFFLSPTEGQAFFLEALFDVLLVAFTFAAAWGILTEYAIEHNWRWGDRYRGRKRDLAILVIAALIGEGISEAASFGYTAVLEVAEGHDVTNARSAAGEAQQAAGVAKGHADAAGTAAGQALTSAADASNVAQTAESEFRTLSVRERLLKADLTQEASDLGKVQSRTSTLLQIMSDTLPDVSALAQVFKYNPSGTKIRISYTPSNLSSDTMERDFEEALRGLPFEQPTELPNPTPSGVYIRSLDDDAVDLGFRLCQVLIGTEHLKVQFHRTRVWQGQPSEPKNTLEITIGPDSSALFESAERKAQGLPPLPSTRDAPGRLITCADPG